MHNRNELHAKKLTSIAFSFAFVGYMKTINIQSYSKIHHRYSRHLDSIIPIIGGTAQQHMESMKYF